MRSFLVVCSAICAIKADTICDYRLVMLRLSLALLLLSNAARMGYATLLDRLTGTECRGDATIDHGRFEPLERRTLLHLCILQLAEKLILETFEIHAFLLVIGDYLSHVMSLSINLMSSDISLLLNELVLLGQPISLLLSYLLLAELSLVVILLTHAI